MIENRPEPYEIHPTAPEKTQEGRYTDIAFSNLLNIYAGQVNSARQVVWQRYTAMLIANSIFFGLIVSAEASYRKLGAVVGIALCCIWVAMLLADWKLFKNRLLTASRFQWTHLGPDANPFPAMHTQEKWLGRVIYSSAASVALIFLIFNIFVLAAS